MCFTPLKFAISRTNILNAASFKDLLGKIAYYSYYAGLTYYSQNYASIIGQALVLLLIHKTSLASIWCMCITIIIVSYGISDISEQNLY